jgi:hypothetical protein
MEDIPENLVDNFCWVEGTYTAKPSKDLTHMGKAGQTDHWKCDPRNDPDDNCWHHTYYQWVALVMICQAGFFYLPR